MQLQIIFQHDEKLEMTRPMEMAPPSSFDMLHRIRLSAPNNKPDLQKKLSPVEKHDVSSGKRLVSVALTGPAPEDVDGHTATETKQHLTGKKSKDSAGGKRPLISSNKPKVVAGAKRRRINDTVDSKQQQEQSLSKSAAVLEEDLAGGNCSSSVATREAQIGKLESRSLDARSEDEEVNIGNTLMRTTEQLNVADSRGRCFLLNSEHEQGCVNGSLFPWILHEMLEDEASSAAQAAKSKTQALKDDLNSEYKAIMSWQPDGRAFTIHKPDLFVKELLPKYFSCAEIGVIKTMNGFKEHLSKWGFVRFTTGPQAGAFVHRCFVRGKRSHCKQMRVDGKMV